MHILFDSEVTADPSLLARCWQGEETFALVPEKSGGSNDWIADKLNCLPDEHRRSRFVLLTSGSTGEPKLIVGLRERSEALVRALHELQQSEPAAETIVTLPLTYSYAFVNQWLWATVFKRRLVVTHGFRQPDLLRASLQQARDAMLCLVGIQVPLLDQNFSNEAFPGVLRVHFAGGRFPHEQLHAIRRLFPNARIFNNYGCAEAMPRLTLRPAEDAQEAANIGRPLPGIELNTSDTGELLFRSPYRAVGVVDQRGFMEITPDMWIGTGDLGSAVGDGTWRLTGRANEVFKRYGEKISLPLLLSTVLRNWSGQAAFYREMDAKGEEGHALMLTPHPSETQVRTILKAFAAEFGRAHWPLRLESVSEMPLLPNGKVNVAALAKITDKSLHWYQR